MFRANILIIGLALCSAGCTTVEQRATRFASLSCAQLATALSYEDRAEQEARVSGVITGVASIFESDSEETLLEIDSAVHFFESGDRRLSVKAIHAEQHRRCAAPAQKAGK